MSSFASTISMFGSGAVRRVGASVVVLFAVLAAWLALATAPASAAIAHNFLGSFTGSDVTGSPSGPFVRPGADAVDASGEVYVLDIGSDVVDKFDPSGGYAGEQITGASTPAGSFSLSPFSGIAVDNSTAANAGDVYVADTGHRVVDRFSATGQYQCQITGAATPSASECNGAAGSATPAGSMTPAGVAVDASGDVYVADSASHAIDEFGPSGNYLGQIVDAHITSPATIALDSSGNLYVTNFRENVVKLDASGAFASVLDSNGAMAVAVDPASSNVYVMDSTPHLQIAEYDTSGNQLDTFGGSRFLTFALGLAVSSVNGQVYASNYSDQLVDMFTGDLLLPDVTTGSAANAGPTTATVSGTVNPVGLSLTDCHFEYGTTTAYGQSAPCVPSAASIPGDSSDHTVTADLSGLTPGTLYHFRLVAADAQGSNPGQDQTFATTSLGFGLQSLGMALSNQDGSPDTQAGSHPYEMTTSFSFNTVVSPGGLQGPAANVKDIVTELPPGLIGDPQAVPKCTRAQLDLSIEAEPSSLGCPQGSQVGQLTVAIDTAGITKPSIAPVYNLVPPAGEPAQFGALLESEPVLIDLKIRTGGDYGVTATVSNVSADLGVTSGSLTLWGVPADPSHDLQRCSVPDTSTTGNAGNVFGNCDGEDGLDNGRPHAAGVPPVALLTNPTSCDGPLTTTMQVDSWQNPGAFATASSTANALTGCGSLTFSPTISVQPDTSAADAPSGLSVDLQVPQDGLLNPTGLAQPDLKDAAVTLPPGISVDPSAANGLTACSPAQIGLDNASQPSCPNASKIGTVEIDTPLLPSPLTGGVYVAQQSNNPFNSLLAIYVTAYDPVSGVLVKLAGRVIANPVTGQLETTFSNNPQLPFSDFKLDFFGGSQGVLATPASCGAFSSTSDLSPWSGGSDATSSDSFVISSGCMSGFSPSFTAGTQNAKAGAYSPFVLSFSRSDTDQNFSGLSVKLPPGMLAKLAGVQECSDAQLAHAAANTGVQEQASPSCPAGSQVGAVTTSAGAGPDPMSLTGDAYLTGPYKGAPYGIAVVVPAVAGPYDLGTVVVRQALDINPTTAQVTDVSDPFPTILDGIPLRIRSISVDLNRPDFTINPTSCDPMAINGTLTSTGGMTDNVSSRFQVGGCQDIGFSPKLKIGLSGEGQTKSGDHPTLTATLTDRSGQANIRSAKVTLPLSMALDPRNSNHVCNYSVAAAVHGGPVGCPASTIVGKATANTPLLSKPLTGNVYLVQGLRCAKGSISAQGTCADGKTAIHTLPTLLVPLRGQIALDLRAKSSVNGAGALVTTFSTIPDAPVSKFTLQIAGGKKGLLVVTGRGLSICAKKQVGDADFGAQSGKTTAGSMTLSTPCAGVKHKAKQHRSRDKSKSRRRAGRVAGRRVS